MSNIRTIARAAGGGTLLAALLYLWAQYVEPYRLELTEPEIACPCLPESWNGVRVLFLTDPHVQAWSRRENLLIAMLRALPEPPDLLFWGGDYLFHFGETEAALQLVRAVQSVFPDVPAFGVLGNAEHKRRTEHIAQFVRDLETSGVRILNNRHETLTLRGETVTIAGVDDPYYGHDDLDAALDNAPADRFTILLSHSPQIVYRAAKAGVDLMLSGHTHGGQVRLPVIGALKTQTPQGRRLDYGLFGRARLRSLLQGRDVPEAFRLYISRGIGVAQMFRWYWLRPRFLCRPEVSLITLRTA